jgi:hypothetical protein
MEGHPMQIDLKADTKKLTKHLSYVQKTQIPFATSRALNDVAFDARLSIQNALPIRLDRPTKGLIKSVIVEKSKKKHLIAIVGFAGKGFGKTKWRESPAEIMIRHIKGGIRRPKSSPQLRIPSDTKGGGIKLNKFGNIAGKKAKIQKMLGDKDKYFSGVPIGDYSKKDAGIWERISRSKAKKKIVQRIAFEPFTKYKGGRFPLSSIVQKTVNRKYRTRFNVALAEALRSAN